MTGPSTRYRVTVTPIEKDGLPCSGRCTIEIEHRAQRDWMRLLEAAPRLAGFSGDERAAVLIASQILHDVVQRHADEADHPLAAHAEPLHTALLALDRLHSPR